jgi:hypothetical protein
LPLEVTWAALETRLFQLAQAAGPLPPVASDRVLERFGLVKDGELTDLGERYYVARFVRQNVAAVTELTAEALKLCPTVNALCEALWRYGELPKSGAMNLLRRLERAASDEQLTRLLEQMGRADLIVYNRRNPKIRGSTTRSSCFRRSKRLSANEPRATSSHRRRPSEIS